MKVCSKCGATNADDAKLCTKCAVSLQQAGGKPCPAGRHIMDPTWSECPYCRAEGALGPATPAPPPGSPSRTPVRKPTVVEGAALEAPTPRPPMRLPTYPEDMPLPPRPMPQPFAKPAAAASPAGQSTKPPRPATVFGRAEAPVAGPPSPPPAPGKDRKIVGVLVSYSWNPQGKIYAIREGRNLIGRDPECDIHVPEDETMSGQNSSIQFRQNFIVRDKDSMSGTDVNGVPVEDQYTLANYAVLRAGSTYFTFLAIQQPAGLPAGTPPASGTAETQTRS
jgi:Inner membrane component of T3SS, cytoplasmic domain/zinc-ribbon domain